MFESLINRENTIFEVLQEFVNQKLYFIIVGGYAVSAYKHRFSVDADIIIRKEDKDKFEEVLKRKKFMRTIVKDLDHVYAPQFVRYETKNELPVSIDLLINGIGSRNTNASFSINELEKYSKQRVIKGIKKEIVCLVPDKEIIIALKLHSGRPTDFRDIVALSNNIDVTLIKNIIWVGKKELVKDNIKRLLSLIHDKGFMDSFKGVFMEKKYDIDIKSLEKLKEL